MKPYYSDDAVTIYHGDCREVLSLLGPAEVVLTDPPYGIEGGRGGDRSRGKAHYICGEWEDTPAYVSEVIVPVLASLLESCDRGAISPGVRNMWAYPEPAAMGCFWTPAGVNHSPWGFSTFHPILYYGRDPRAGVGALPNGKVMTEAAGVEGFPCPKPLASWRWLLDKVAGPSPTTVVDPFLGSGTTLRAAKDLGLRAVGIEIEERYCEIAAKRMGQEVFDFGAAA